MAYGPVTVACGHPPCPRRMSWDFTTRQMAYGLARAKGWLAKRDLVRCPLHVAHLPPPPPKSRVRTGRRRWDDAEERRIATEYAGGLSTPVLAQKYGTAPNVIRRAILRQGYTMRPTGTRSKP